MSRCLLMYAKTCSYSFFFFWTHVFVYFLLFPKLDCHLCYGVYSCNFTPPHILILWFLVYFHFVICASTIVRSLCLPTSVLQTSKLYNDMHVWIHRNLIETWLQSKYLINLLHMLNINNEMSKLKIKTITTWHKQWINRNMTKIKIYCNKY